MTSELQANVVDICPVGALTSKPYAFAARPWELNKTESIDVMDALGCAIRIDTRGREVMRILPRTNEDINEEWISDKTRHVVDGLRTQRLDQPYVRENGKLRPASWSEAFKAIAAKVARGNPKRIGALVGDLAAVEEIFALKDLMTRLGVVNLDCRQDGSALDPEMGPGELSVQPDHRRHRDGRCAAHRRLEPAQGSRHPQCAHPQALARRQFPDRRDRRRRPISPTLTTISAPARKRWPIFRATALPRRCARPSGRWCWSARRRSRVPTARRSRRSRPRPRSISAR